MRSITLVLFFLSILSPIFQKYVDAILACFAMNCLFCILWCGIWWGWVAKMSERNYKVFVYGE